MKIAFWIFLTGYLVRYFVLAGGAFWWFYRMRRAQKAGQKLQAAFPTGADIRREIGYSLASMGIFAGVAYLIFNTAFLGYTQIYFQPDAYPRWYLPVSVVLALLVHDTYFYWTHRAMHHPRLFRTFHRVHHQSTNPSPWATFSFHPTEAIVEALAIVPIVCLVPMYLWALFAFIVFNTAYSVYGHLGYELYPRWVVRSRLGRWLNTSTNHNQHHRYFTYNYGLYFRFWDEWMGTTDPRYAEAIEVATAPSNPH